MLNLYYHLDERSALNKVNQSLFYTIYRRDYLPLHSVLVMELSAVKVNYFSLIEIWQLAVIPHLIQNLNPTRSDGLITTVNPTSGG